MSIVIILQGDLVTQIAARDRMIQSASRMLAEQGYEATSFRNVIEASKAPRGSIYHHFPEGKDQMVCEALDLQRDRALALLSAPATTATEVVNRFVDLWVQILTATDFSVGCSLVGVTTGGAPAGVRETAGNAFTSWAEALTASLSAVDEPPARPASLALMMLASCEGAVVIARAGHSIEPLETVRAELLVLLHASR